MLLYQYVSPKFLWIYKPVFLNLLQVYGDDVFFSKFLWKKSGVTDFIFVYVDPRQISFSTCFVKFLGYKVEFLEFLKTYMTTSSLYLRIKLQFWGFLIYKYQDLSIVSKKAEFVEIVICIWRR